LTRVNIYAVLTTMTALLIAAAVLAGSLAYRARQRRTSRLGRLEDAVIGRQINDLAAGTMEPTEATQLLRELRYLPTPGSRDAQQQQRERQSAWNGAFSFPENEGGTSRLGYRIFKWLLFLGFFLLSGLMGYAWWTYPTTNDATQLLPLGATLTDRLNAVQELRRDWLQQVKDLGQVFVLTPVFPLIGTVVGYLFGVRRSARDRMQVDSMMVPVEPEQPKDPQAALEASEALTRLAEANKAVPTGRQPRKTAARRATTAGRTTEDPAAEAAGIPTELVTAGTGDLPSVAEKPKRAPRRTTRRTEE
jgi:hypothetical protein